MCNVYEWILFFCLMILMIYLGVAIAFLAEKVVNWVLGKEQNIFKIVPLLFLLLAMLSFRN